MQSNVDNYNVQRRNRICLWIILIVICLAIVLALVINAIILVNYFEHDAGKVLDNKVTQDSNSNRSTTEESTTHLSIEITSAIQNTEPDISSTSSPNHWIVDSQLITERNFPGAVVMENGEILVSGGGPMMDLDYNLMRLSSTEIYSSLSRKWRTVAEMQIPRGAHTLTTLKDGKGILAVGDFSQIDTFTAEIYDLKTNRWAFVPSIMDVGRCYHTATLLQNGQVLLVGGKNLYEWDAKNSNVQLYDPSSNTFITTGTMKMARFSHTATLLNDGLSVLVIGGTDIKSDGISTAEVYTAGSWSNTTGDLIVARNYHAAVLLPDGNVLVAGGFDIYDQALSSVEIYNSTTRTFSLAQPMACARSKLTLTLLPSGQVLAVGGIDSTRNECLLVTELYDPIIDQWTNSSLLNIIRYGHVTVLINNSVLAIGGEFDDFTQLKQCERYDL